MLLLLSQYWPILLPSALGSAAIYLLLPRVHRFPPLYGAVFSCLALVAIGWLVIRADWPVVETGLFYCFAGVAIVFGGLMITQRNPVHAALSFAMVILGTCGLFLLQAAPFLMAATIIIYAGAIVVTFLFVIMLAQQEGLSNADQRSREPFLATVAGFVLLVCLLCFLHKTYSTPQGDILEAFTEQAARASTAKTVRECRDILGDEDTFFVKFRQAVEPPDEHRTIDAARRELVDKIQEAQLDWNAVRPPEEGPMREDQAGVFAQFQKELADVCQLSGRIRDSQGSLFPGGRLPLSTFAGAPANEAVPFIKDGKPVERLPASNVAGLGKTLFTDYLLAVELAGTLLLIATIGAIAIVSRRPEGLR
jgi:NADH-quinone oxidoreductase subunit J